MWRKAVNCIVTSFHFIRVVSDLEPKRFRLALVVRQETALPSAAAILFAPAYVSGVVCEAAFFKHVKPSTITILSIVWRCVVLIASGRA